MYFTMMKLGQLFFGYFCYIANSCRTVVFSIYPFDKLRYLSSGDIITI